ncbi:MAG: dTMP kinase, partial [Carnobacterium jeotgali]|uniref:dTMP kinase n=1 Tax=Carnobacterium jeotgali TaxID=545534 RepID=UPI003C780866
DRFVDSSLAYQGVARGIGISEVAEINQFATDNLSPDLTLYLDIEAHLGLERINQNKNNRQFDRLDQETLEFHEKVRSAYLTIAKEQSERIVQIDASQELEKVVAECYQTIIKRIKG